MNPLKVTVIGGSLGGLCTAISLRQLGHSVDIYEKSPGKMESRGAGLVVQYELIEYLRHQGINMSETISVPITTRRYLNRDGSTQSEQTMPQSFTSWDAVFRQLRELFPDANYHAGKNLIGIDQHDRQITASFEEGSVVASDLLVFADGSDSTARRLLLPDVQPRYAGYVAWRGLIDEAVLPKKVIDFFEDSFTFYQMPQSHILNYLIPGSTGGLGRGERRMNWVWYRNVRSGNTLDQLLTDKNGAHRYASVAPGSVQNHYIDEMRKFAVGHLPPIYQELIEASPAPFIQAIMDVEVPRMNIGRACLLGDAAFVIRPHTAASTAKAAADAMALAAHLAKHAELEIALRAWETQQLAFGDRLYSYGVDMGTRSQGVAAAVR